MTRKPESELMELADREVDDAATLGGLTSDERAKVDAVGELGELVRGHLELSADAVADAKFARAWDQIEKRIALASDAEAPTGANTETAETAGGGGGLWRRAGRWFDRYRGHVITGAVSASAVAAIALYVHAPVDEARRSGSGQPIDVRPAAYRPAELESLDTPGGVSSVFHLEEEDGRTTTVIWVTPQDQDMVEDL